jgi:hypothetical protein
MNRDKRSSSNDPTDEPAADQSTQSASGLGAGREGPGVERNRTRARAADRNDDLVTPRRYEQPIEADEDPAGPGD